MLAGEAADGLEAVQKARELKPDLILLDIGLPYLNGLEASSQIHRIVPEAAILFVSQINDVDVVLAALSNGGRGYILKSDAGKELRRAIRAVLSGSRFFSSGLMRQCLLEANAPLSPAL